MPCELFLGSRSNAVTNPDGIRLPPYEYLSPRKAKRRENRARLGSTSLAPIVRLGQRTEITEFFGCCLTDFEVGVSQQGERSVPTSRIITESVITKAWTTAYSKLGIILVRGVARFTAANGSAECSGTTTGRRDRSSETTLRGGRRRVKGPPAKPKTSSIDDRSPVRLEVVSRVAFDHRSVFWTRRHPSVLHA